MLRQALLIVACLAVDARASAPLPGATHDIADAAGELGRRATDPDLARAATRLARAARSGGAIEAAYVDVRDHVGVNGVTDPAVRTLWRALERSHAGLAGLAVR